MKGHTNNPNGRPKGIADKRTLRVAELAEECGVDPAKYLILRVKGDRRELGYEDVTIVQKRIRDWENEQREIAAKKKGKKFEPEPVRELTEQEIKEANMFSPEERDAAAKELMPYIHGKRKPVDSQGDDSTDLFSVLLDAVDGNK